MKKILPVILVLLALFSTLTAQENKKVLTHDDIESWKRITEKVISSTGDFIAYKTEPWKGDTELFLYSFKGDELGSYECGTDAKFTYDSKHLVFKVVPDYKTVRELKLKKAGREDMPGDRLCIVNLENMTERKIERISKTLVPEKWSGWIAYQVETSQNENISGNEENAGESGEKINRTTYFYKSSAGRTSGVVIRYPGR